MLIGRDVNTQRAHRHFAVRLADSVVTDGIDTRTRTGIPRAVPACIGVARTPPIILLHPEAGQIVGRVRYPYGFASFRIIDAQFLPSRVRYRFFPAALIVRFPVAPQSMALAGFPHLHADCRREHRRRLRDAETPGCGGPAHGSL
ncbi:MULTISPECIES: hypothetical protein [unclassified Caballeronia]|uniref:hypothetical protein n=1 Tax=unclassified Caballeronia TaxID=2646786 RepID=UPI001F29D0FF|nr:MULTISPECIES: hypothetical protein [unclassified Caballeronia]MCE4542397.1 hypothetical protein [Caballeronia sp. PC1]MCE4568548.1 hypothetical protein [Caballeronia sp. CLC5]